MWTSDSSAIMSCDTAHKYPQMFPNLVSDENGGVYVIWEDIQPNQTQILYQHFDSTGAMQLDSGGSPVCTFKSFKNNLTAVSDNNGGFVAAWEDGRDSAQTGTDIYAQHVAFNPAYYGAQSLSLAWAAAGVPVVQWPGNQLAPQVTCDASGDAYIVWQDYRNGYAAPDYSGADLYGQLLNDSTGAPMWTADGAVVVSAPQDQFGQQVSLDDSGGLFVSWVDNRATGGTDETNYADSHIYAKHLRRDSTVLWGGATGVPVCTAANSQNQPVMLTANNSILLAWHDERNQATTGDIYAQWVIPPGVNLVAPSVDTLNFGSIVTGTMSSQQVTVNNPMIQSGLIIDSVAISDPHFSTSIPINKTHVIVPYNGSKKITFDFTPTANVPFTALVQIFDSITTVPDTIYLTGSGGGGPNLQTDSNTLNFGSVVAGRQLTDTIEISNPGNAPLEITSIATAQKTIFQASPATLTIAAGDSAGVAITFSPASSSHYTDTLTLVSNTTTSPNTITLFGTGTTTAVEELPVSSSYNFWQNYPNPFQASTTFRFTLPATEHADVALYDMLGRRVATIAEGIFAQGAHDVLFDGSTLPTGMYTCVLQAGGSRIAREIVRVR